MMRMWLGREIVVVSLPPLAQSGSNYFTFNNFYISFVSLVLQQKKNVKIKRNISAIVFKLIRLDKTRSNGSSELKEIGNHQKSNRS